MCLMPAISKGAELFLLYKGNEPLWNFTISFPSPTNQLCGHKAPFHYAFPMMDGSQLVNSIVVAARLVFQHVASA